MATLRRAVPWFLNLLWRFTDEYVMGFCRTLEGDEVGSDRQKPSILLVVLVKTPICTAESLL